jgi:hypothetical protein
MLCLNIPTGSRSVVVVNLGTDCSPKPPITIVEGEPTWLCLDVRKHGGNIRHPFCRNRNVAPVVRRTDRPDQPAGRGPARR